MFHLENLSYWIFLSTVFASVMVFKYLKLEISYPKIYKMWKNILGSTPGIKFLNKSPVYYEMSEMRKLCVLNFIIFRNILVVTSEVNLIFKTVHM